jgi:predicted histone-like DNA-binding protein
MSLQYKAVKITEAGVAGGGNEHYVARLTRRQSIDVSEIAEMIARRSSFGRADIVGVITALTEITGELLLENKTVQLGDLGTYSLHVKATPVDAPEKVVASTIKSLSISFRASPVLKKKMKASRYTRKV